MAEEGILFSAIHHPREEKCLAEYLRGSSRAVAQEARQLLRSLPKRVPGEKKSYNHKRKTFNMLTGPDETVFLCVTNEEFPRMTVFDCLAAMERALVQFRTDPVRLDEEVHRLTEKFSDPDANKVAKLKNEVAAVKTTMLDNIDRVVERGGKIEDLCAQTETMANEAKKFESSSKQLKRAMWKKRCCMYVGIVVLLLVIAVVVSFFLCREDGFNWNKCTKHFKKSPPPPPPADETPAPPTLALRRTRRGVV